MLRMFYEGERGSSEKRLDSKPPGSLDLFDQPEMEQFFTKGVRGGQSFIVTRHARGSDDPKSPSDHLLYVDGKFFFSIFLRQDKLWD